MLKYTICEEIVENGEGSSTDYGICVYVDNVLVDGVLHISPDKEFVSRLVQMFNEGGLSLIHFKSVVEDFVFLDRAV